MILTDTFPISLLIADILAATLLFKLTLTLTLHLLPVAHPLVITAKLFGTLCLLLLTSVLLILAALSIVALPVPVAVIVPIPRGTLLLGPAAGSLVLCLLLALPVGVLPVADRFL